jgi:hypothetical protein
MVGVPDWQQMAAHKVQQGSQQRALVAVEGVLCLPLVALLKLVELVQRGISKSLPTSKEVRKWQVVTRPT